MEKLYIKSLGERISMKKDDNKYFWEYFSNANIEQEKLEEIIRAYSHFLSISNSDFKYNETYLPSFCYEFLNFKEKGTLKYNCVGLQRDTT